MNLYGRDVSIRYKGCNLSVIPNHGEWAFIGTSFIWVHEILITHISRDAIYDFETEAPRELYVQPYCGHYRFPNSMKTLDHLEGVSGRENLHIAAESGLKDAFLGLTGEDNPTMQYMSTRIAIGMAHVSLETRSRYFQVDLHSTPLSFTRFFSNARLTPILYSYTPKLYFRIPPLQCHAWSLALPCYVPY